MTGSGGGAAGGPRGHPVGAEAVQGEARMNEATAGRRGLAGRVAVVTGGAGGIGRAVVERLDREGATVRVLDIAASRGGWTTRQAIQARKVHGPGPGARGGRPRGAGRQAGDLRTVCAGLS